MLRIITRKREATYRLELHGTIAGEWIAVLERYWRDILNAVPSATTAVGLSNVGSSIGTAKSCSAGWRSAA